MFLTFILSQHYYGLFAKSLWQPEDWLTSTVHFNCYFIRLQPILQFYKAPASIVIIFLCHVFYIQVNKWLQGVQHQSRGECHSKKGMPSHVCTRNIGVPEVKAHWALVMAL